MMIYNIMIKLRLLPIVKNISRHHRYIRPNTNSLILQTFQPTRLTSSLHFTFVNVQIDSKYYHTQLPTKVNQILDLLTK
jgi:hypothetical protein